MEDNVNNIKIILKAIEARDLLSGDLNGLSDPYLKIPNGQEGVLDLPPKNDKTKSIFKTLNPVWNEEFIIELNPMKCSKLKIEVYDYDYIGKDDFLGAGYSNLAWIKNSNKNVMEEWIPLSIEKMNKKTKQIDKKKKGSVHIKIKLLGFLHITDDKKKPFKIKDEFPIESLQSIYFQKNKELFLLDSWTIITEKELFVGLGWDVPKKEKLEADATVLALDFELNPITNVYYFNLSAFDGSLVHFGDKVSTSDKQLIHIFLDKIPENVHYLTVILLSDEDNSLDKFNNTYIKLFNNKKEKIGKFMYNKIKGCFAIILGIFQRDPDLNIWYFRVMAQPFQKRYIQDTANNIEVLIGKCCLNKKLNKLMKNIEKNQKHPFPCEDLYYLKKWVKVKPKLINVGLGWTLKIIFDIFISIYCFDDKYNLIQTVDYHNICDQNGSIALRNDKYEKNIGTKDISEIYIAFNRLNNRISTLAICIQCLDGNYLSDISNGFIRLFDKYGVIGVNIFSDFPKQIGMIFGQFRRNNNNWYFEALDEPIKTNNKDDFLNEIKLGLEKNTLII